MSKASLPSRPDLGWLKKRAKEVLVELRRDRPKARLAEAQLVVAREYGLSSWRALVQEVEERRAGPAGPPDLQEDLVHAIGPHPFWGGRPQALHVAIDTNGSDMVRLLLRAGADPNDVG